MPPSEATKAIDDLNRAFTEFKEANDQRLKDIEEKGHAPSDLDEKLTKINAKMDALEVKLQRPEFDYSQRESEEKARERAASKEFAGAFMRKGFVEGDNVKLLATDQDTQGGIWMPRNTREAMLELLVEFNPVRDLSTIETISLGDSLQVMKEGDTSAAFGGGWVSERESRPETATGTFASENIPVHEMYANPRTTQKMLDDGAFDVERWLNRKVAQKFQLLEGLAFISGNAIGKPEGVLTNGDIATVNTSDANLLTADGLLDLFYALPDFYARNGTFVMRRATVGAIRKLKDGQGQYLWAPGFSGNIATTAPATILGQPYRESPDMPAVAAAAVPIMFGDWRAGYLIVDRQGIRVIRDQLTSKPFVEFYTTRRVGGQVVLAEAFRSHTVSA